MNTKDIFISSQNRKGLSQDELAAKFCRQAVSRWKRAKLRRMSKTLKLLSVFFNVSINTFGSPRQLICQCCGMPRRFHHQ